MDSLFITSLLVWLKLLLPGVAWVWILPEHLRREESPLRRTFFFGAGAIMLGVLLTGISTLICGEAGIFTSQTETIVRAVIIFSGVTAGLYLHGRKLVHIIADTLPVGVIMLIGIVVVLALPHRGEWIAGGWDPGVYTGQAVALSRTGTFYPDDSFFYELLTPEEQQAFTRSGHGRTERFPGVIVKPEKESFTFEFFKFTPAFFAAIHRAGGMAAMLRANTIVALLIAPCFFALLLKSVGWATAGFATLILVTQPVFLYHTHWPVTEPLQLLLLCGLLYVSMLPARLGSTLLAVLFIMAAIFNRFSFLPFVGIFIMCLAIGEAMQRERLAIFRRHLLFIAAAIVAAGINYHIAPTSLRGWSDTQLILVFSACAATAALLLDVVVPLNSIKTRMARLQPLHIDLAAATFLLLLIMSWLLRHHIGRTSDVTNLQRLIPFTGVVPMLLAAAGGIILLFHRPRLKAAVFFPLFFFFLSVAWLMILRKSIVDWFPWATRRYYQTLLPWIAISAGYLLAYVFSLQPKRLRWAGKALSGVLLLVLLVELVPTSWRAWRYTSYNGLDQQMAEITAHIGPRDILVADHPMWGTPLALIHGVKVLNGRELWSDDSGKTMETIVPAFERLVNEGWKIRFLTGTETGIDVYPLDSNHFNLEQQFPPYEYQRIIQHSHANHYALETATAHFRIYKFVP